MRIVLLSHHWFLSPRQAGFHHLARALVNLGHEVTFATTGISWLSYLRRDYRTRYPGLWQARNKMRQVDSKLSSYVHFTIWHPHSLILPWLNKLSAPFMHKYADIPLGPLRHKITEADIIFFESSPGLFLHPLVRKLNPRARLVYRVSDDIAMLGSTHPALLALEQQVAPAFDLISLPSIGLAHKFNGLANVEMQPHAIDKKAFDLTMKNPYPVGSVNCVFVGNSHFDAEFIESASSLCPDINFHIIGPVVCKQRKSNIICYGELPFKQTLPYIKFANVGLQNRKGEAKSIALLNNSLKVIQYRYYGLPIIAPATIDLKREGVFYYEPGHPVSCAKAVREALKSGQNLAWRQTDNILSWDELARNICDTVCSTGRGRTGV